MDRIVEASRVLLEKGSRSFASAACIFDADTRASAYMLYAWCRHCDDAIDGQRLGHDAGTGRPHDPRAVLARLRVQTEAALDGRPDGLVFEALRRVVDKHAIPHVHPYELLEGFAMDVEGRRYTTIEDTLDYCYHVAGVVGVMMAMIMGVRDRAILDRASDLGIAFQLTNISRDVIPDAANGRIYLPADWLAEAGIAEAEIAAPVNRAALYGVTRRLLDEADRYYVSARYGLPHLPLRAAWAVAAARRIYRDIGNILRRRRDHAWDRRAVVSKGRKLADAAYAGLSVARAHVSGAIKPPRPRVGLWTHPGLGEPPATATMGPLEPDDARGDSRSGSR
jgi:phytoene synthase